MPNVLVETRGGWLGAKRTAFLAAIQAATVEALRIPPGARPRCRTVGWWNVRPEPAARQGRSRQLLGDMVRPVPQGDAAARCVLPPA